MEKGQISRAKSLTIGVFFMVTALAFTGCESLENFLTSLLGGGQESAEDRPSQGTPSSGTAPRPTSKYVIPVSYETAYAYRTDATEQAMRNIPRNIETNRTTNPDEYIRQITAYINEGSQNDFERVKKAHDLVALLVRYDAVSFWANNIPDQSYTSVLKTRLAVCEGYANLFKKLCDELKIPCDIVHGFARGVGTSPFAGDTPTDSNHAWNIVAVGGEHYLIDCTWDSGHMEGRVSKQEYNTAWLFLKPEHFLHTHFPENSQQQLMAKPLTATEFLKLPFYAPKFFEVVSEISPNLVNINQVDGKLTLEYTVKDGFEVAFNIYDETGGTQFPNSAFSQREGDTYKAYFAFPASGKYLLRAFWKQAGANTGTSCAELGIISSSGSTVSYPTQYTSSGKNVQIISPIEMPLKRGQKYEFKLRVDNKNVVAIIYGRTFIQLTKGEDGVFSGELVIPNNINELSIGISDSAQGRYETIVGYKVN
jgi:hypothetical protein